MLLPKRQRELFHIRLALYMKMNPILRTGLSLMLTVVLFSAAFAAGQEAPAPSLPAGLGLLDVVRTTIARNPNVSIQKQQVESSQGALQQASGKFDETLGLSLNRQTADSPLNSSLSPYYIPPFNKQDTTGYTMSLTRQLRSGITLLPSLSMTRVEATSPYAFLSQGVGTENQGVVSFSVLVPLLKGLGEDVAAAGESSAKNTYEAERLYLNYTVAQNVFNAVQSYWSYVTAVKRLAIFVESEQRAQVLLASTRKLIEHDQRPAASISLVEANLSSKRASRIAAEQALSDARKDLGLNMGLGAAEIARLAMPSGNEISEAGALMIPGPDKDQYFIDMSLERRTDLKSLLSRQEAAKIGKVAAQKNMLPQLDLNLQAGYNSLSEKNAFGDYLTAYGNNASGLNTTAVLQYTWPIRNNDARGYYAQQKANYEKAAINVARTSDTIGAGVANALSSLRKMSLQLTESKASVLSYRKAVDNELKRFTLGQSTLNDVITNENYLVSARLDEATSFQNVAGAIISLRFQTGTIISPGTETFTVSLKELTSVPEPTH